MGNVFRIISKSQGKVREEFVDVKKNTLFRGAKTPREVKRAYEAFWSMDEYEPKVTVLKVIPSNARSKGESWGIKFLTKKKLKEVM